MQPSERRRLNSKSLLTSLSSNFSFFWGEEGISAVNQLEHFYVSSTINSSPILQSGSAVLLNYQPFNWNDNSLCGFFFCNRVLPQCALQVRDNVKFQVLKNAVWCRIFFVCIFLSVHHGHIISSSVRHFPMLLHLNNHEVHKFIILLRESSFWYFFLYALRTHSHYWLHFPPTYFLLMECVDCVSPRCRSCCCFVGFFPSSLTLLPLFFMISLFLSSHQWDLGPHSVEILKTVEELSPNVLFVFLPGELFCRRVGFLHPVVLVSEGVHTLITLCPSRGRTKIVKRPFFHPIGGSILPFPYELSSCVILK